MSLTTADTQFSKYIRLRDSVDGMVTCFICGRSIPINEATAGHFIKRRHMATRFDERNVHGMCFRCNQEEEGNTEVSDLHYIKMRDRYSHVVIDELYFRSRQPFHMSKSDINEIAKTYREKIKEL